MGIFHILIGLFVAFVIYIYVLSKSHEISDRRKLLLKKNDFKTGTNHKDEPNEQLKNRFCPLCGSSLNQEDSLYAEMYEAEPHPKVFIHGCKYCYAHSRKVLNAN